MSTKSLLIVESPGKIKTLSKFLGKDFVVEASKGHIIDLLETRLGVDSENGFVPAFHLVRDREEVISRLRQAARTADRIFLAPDPDREGEAISWHLASVLNIDPMSSCRVTFNSITRDDVLQALDNPRPINLNLVNAQQSRRILDRLVGYRLSPLLWKKVSLGLSAGRVQSVAVLLVCSKEKEILAFKPEEFWTISVQVKPERNRAFSARLVKTNGRKSSIENAETALKAVEEIQAAEIKVAAVAKKARKQLPSPPFITSTLQQEAAQRFSFTSKRTMSIAQRLYEGVEIASEGQVGLITYMRTDSVRIAPEGTDGALDYIRKTFGPVYSLEHARVFKTKKGAQDAHEAIRPTSVWRTPESLASNLKPEALKLYTLIWKRFVATQMAEAQFEVVTIDLRAGPHILSASGTTQIFDGFTRLYSETQGDEEASTDPAEAAVGAKAAEAAERAEMAEMAEERKQKLPEVAEGDAVTLSGVEKKQNSTAPPPRFSESILIKTLEKEGIGRPSTYATIIETIQQRGYVKKVEGRFRPSDAAFLTTQILTSSFGDIITPGFTARMETSLDDVEDGNRDWMRILADFYGPFLSDLKKADSELQKAQLASDCVCSKCGRPMVVKLGRTGKFLACSGYPECRTTENIPEELLLFAGGRPSGPVPLRKILDEYKEKQGPATEATDQICETCGSPMLIRTGRFGKFIACSKYPECKTTHRIVQDAGVACPIPGCDGRVVIKKSRKRRVFYGCSKYPTCTMTTWEKPTGELCPECKAALVWHTTKKLGQHVKCSGKACQFRILTEGGQIAKEE